MTSPQKTFSDSRFRWVTFVIYSVVQEYHLYRMRHATGGTAERQFWANETWIQNLTSIDPHPSPLTRLFLVSVVLWRDRAGSGAVGQWSDGATLASSLQHNTHATEISQARCIYHKTRDQSASSDLRHWQTLCRDSATIFQGNLLLKAEM